MVQYVFQAIELDSEANSLKVNSDIMSVNLAGYSELMV